jgi:membrane fusion protein (multidrug efflux system)
MLAVACKSGGPAAKADGGEAKAVPVVVHTAKVVVQPMPQVLVLTGTLVAERQSELAANVAGRLVAVNVERGQAVKAGQAVAVVDSRAAAFSASAAAAQAKAADTQVRLAQSECERADTLFAQGAISQAEFDRQKTTCTAQLFSADAARANAGLATKLAGDSVIRAPFDGVVGERYVQVGEAVQPASRVASIYVVDPLRIAVSVPERAVGAIRPGQPIEFSVAAFPARTFAATVRFVGPALRPTTRDLVVEAVASNEKGLLKPGMFAMVRVITGEKEETTVPTAAVSKDGPTKRIFVVRGGQAIERVVRTGEEKEGRVAVVEDLTAQDEVVVEPPPELRDGAPVALR